MKRLLSIVVSLLLVLPLFAEGGAAAKRPKVGLVFAGGGAKGSAHIGVLKYIEEMGIPIDFVTGTSMGSIIGGLTALGYSSAEMNEIIGGMDWSVYMSNSVDRSMLTYSSREAKERYLLTIPFGTGTAIKALEEHSTVNKEDGSVRMSLLSTLPSGFIDGQNLLNLFSNLSVGYQDSISFNDLPIPYACVSMNLITGEQRVLRSGNLPQSIRASMAIPGVFSPVRIGNDLLVDGGLVNNFPVDICRTMGADYIIGVEVNQDMKTRADEIKSLPDILTQLLKIETSGGLEENRSQCDIYIRPSTKGFGMLSFDRKSVDTLIARGYNEASKYYDQFMELKQKLGDYEATPKPTSRKRRASYAATDSVEISGIQMHGLDEYESHIVLKYVMPLIGNKVVSKDIEQSIKRLVGTNGIKSITYSLLGDKAPYTLVYTFEKAAPNRIGFGFRYDSEEAAALLLSVGYHTQQLRGFSAEFLGKLAYNPRVEVKLGYNGGLFSRINMSYAASSSTFSMNFFQTLKTQVTQYKHDVKLYLSDAYYKNNRINVGARFEKFIGKNILSEGGALDSIPILSGNFASCFIKYNFDNIDNAFFPTRGARIGVEGSFYPNFFKDVFMVDNPFYTAELDAMVNIPISKRLVFIPSLYYRRIFDGEFVFPFQNYVGGEQAGRYFDQQIPFVGINEIVGVETQVAVARADLRVLLSPKLYLAGIFNYMRDGGFTKSLYDYGRNVLGAGLKCAYNSPLGPISLTLNWSDNSEKKFGAYFNLGYYF